MILANCFGVIALFLVVLNEVSSLRDVKLITEPPLVLRGGTVALICSRDMEGSPLYSVKWYRGIHEFYRYTPNEIPNSKVFGLPGIIVDMNTSNDTVVKLRKMDLGLSGNFSCEVTTDTTPFSAVTSTNHIDVIAPPSNDPVLISNKDSYQPGEVLKANCTSLAARPPANLTIFVNDEMHHSATTTLHPSEAGLYWSNVHVEIEVTPELFATGRLRVTCLATIYNVYRSTATLDFFSPDSDPRPERITFNSAAENCKTLTNWFLLILLFFLPMMAMGQDFFVEDSFIDSYPNYDDTYKDVSFSLL